MLSVVNDHKNELVKLISQVMHRMHGIDLTVVEKLLSTYVKKVFNEEQPFNFCQVFSIS